MGGDPKGGKVCWPGSTPAAATVWRQWIPATEMDGATGPFSAAGSQNYSFANGFRRRLKRFRKNKCDAAAFDFAVPEYLGLISAGQFLVFWFLSGSGTNPVNWKLYGNPRDPGQVITSSLGSLAQSSVPAGDEKLVVDTYSVVFNDPVIPDDYYTGILERCDDNNNANAWLLGIEIRLELV